LSMGATDIPKDSVYKLQGSKTALVRLVRYICALQIVCICSQLNNNLFSNSHKLRGLQIKAGLVYKYFYQDLIGVVGIMLTNTTYLSLNSEMTKRKIAVLVQTVDKVLRVCSNSEFIRSEQNQNRVLKWIHSWCESFAEGPLLYSTTHMCCCFFHFGCLSIFCRSNTCLVEASKAL
jgi:hypothetical protein